MDHPAEIKKQPAAAAVPPRPPAAAAAAAKKKPTTLLDAYEVECIRGELERLVLKHNHQSAAAGGETAAAPTNAHGRHRHHENHLHHQRVSSARKATSAKRVSPSPSPSLPPPAPPGPKKGRRGRGLPLLGRHAVAICTGTVPVAGAPVSGRGRRVVAMCRGTAAPVACAAVGVGVSGGRRRATGRWRRCSVPLGTSPLMLRLDNRLIC